MPTESVTRPIARELIRAVLGVREIADRDLLERFVRSRDEEAFAELVRRHGRMVLAVGRRVTGHPQDAEDAFQAAFLVLARRAGHLKRPDQLANWLYGVAYRTALEARAARRRAWEHIVAAASEPMSPIAPDPPDDTSELRRVIDEELSQLPDKYRTAVVMCDLEGLQRTEAAARLKIPEGTLSSRLAYARKLLAGRLTRRGITSTAGAVAVALNREALGSTVPRELLLLTARSAARSAAGAVVPADLVSPSVSSITNGVMKTMFVHRLRLMIGSVLGLGLVGLGAAGFAQFPGQAERGQPPAIAVGGQPVPTDPIAGLYDVQPKPEKVAAKGIEDDDVPLPATPSQAVLRVEDGKLIVRQRTFQYAPVTVAAANGQAVTGYQAKSGVGARTYDPADVSVFDMKGNRLQNKQWRDKFKNDVHALVAYDGKLPNPRELALFKDDALLVVLPSGAPGAANYGFYDFPVPTTTPAYPGVPRSGSLTPAVPAPGRTAPPAVRPYQPGSQDELPPMPGTTRPSVRPAGPGSQDEAPLPDVQPIRPGTQDGVPFSSN